MRCDFFRGCGLAPCAMAANLGAHLDPRENGADSDRIISAMDPLHDRHRAPPLPLRTTPYSGRTFRGLLRGVLLARPKVTTFGAGFNLRPLPCPPAPSTPPSAAPRSPPRCCAPAVVRPLLCARCCAPRCCAPRFSVPRRVTRAPPWRHTGPCSSRHTSTPSAESVWGCDCSPHRTACKRSHWARHLPPAVSSLRVELVRVGHARQRV